MKDKNKLKPPKHNLEPMRTNWIQHDLTASKLSDINNLQNKMVPVSVEMNSPLTEDAEQLCVSCYSSLVSFRAASLLPAKHHISSSGRHSSSLSKSNGPKQIHHNYSYSLSGQILLQKYIERYKNIKNFNINQKRKRKDKNPILAVIRKYYLMDWMFVSTNTNP